MRIRSIIVAGLMGLVMLVGTAVGDRASTLLDALETAMQTRLTAEESLPEPNRKIVKLLTTSLRKIDRDTTTDTADLKLLKKIVGPLSGRLADDIEISGEVGTAIAAADSDLADVIAAARALIDGAEEGKKQRKADRTALSAQKLRDKWPTKKTVKAQVSVLAKARGKADKALVQAGKLTPVANDGLVSRAVIVAETASGVNRLMQIDFPAATISEIDTGPGEISITSPVPITSPDGTMTAFEQGPNLVVVDFGGPTPVVGGPPPTGDWLATGFSQDSNRLAAATTDMLIVCDLAGNVIHSDSVDIRIPPEPLDPLLFSPDRRYLAYRTSGGANGASQLWVVDLTNGNETKISDTGVLFDSLNFVNWSPTGNVILFIDSGDSADATPDLRSYDMDTMQWTTHSADGQNVVRSASPILPWPVISDSGMFAGYSVAAPGGQAVMAVPIAGGMPVEIATGSKVWGCNAFPDEDRFAMNMAGDLSFCDADGTDSVDVATSCRSFQVVSGACAYLTGELFVSDNELTVCDSSGGMQTPIIPSDAAEYSSEYDLAQAGSKLIVFGLAREDNRSAYKPFTRQFDFVGPGVSPETLFGPPLPGPLDDVFLDLEYIKHEEDTIAVIETVLTYDSVTQKWFYCRSQIHETRLFGPMYVEVESFVALNLAVSGILP